MGRGNALRRLRTGDNKRSRVPLTATSSTTDPPQVRCRSQLANNDWRILSGLGKLHVGSLLSVPDEKPAGTIPVVREEGVHAGLLDGWIKNHLSPPIFVGDSVIMFDGYAAKGLVIRCQTVSKYAIVRSIGDSQQTHTSQEQSQSNSSEAGAGFIA